MKTKHLLLILAFLITPLIVNAQICTQEEEEVWEFVQKSYEAYSNMDIDTYMDMLDDKYAGWNNGKPYVTPKETMVNDLKRSSMDQNLKIQYKIIPEKIIVKGNSAAAFYYYSWESTWGEGEDKGEWRTKGRYTDFLIKENGKWKFLAGMGVREKE